MTGKRDSHTSPMPDVASSFCWPMSDGVSAQTIAMVRRHEGWSANPYQDGDGFSVGYGTHFPLSKIEGEWLMRNRLVTARADAASLFKGFEDLDGTRQAVLVDMAYQLGSSGLSGFRLLRAAVARHDWEAAKAEMLDSKWARQTPGRARELAEMMLAGDA